MTIKIFKHDEGKLTEIEKKHGSKPFKDEKEMQKLIEKNVDAIFPGVEFVESEFALIELRIDTVCFNKETNSFVIIEYKNDKHGGVIDQGMAYLDLLEKNREAFLILYQKQKNELLENVNWDETKIIIIAPEYTPHQLRASFRTKDPIELWEIKRFDDETFTLEKIHDKEKGKKTYRQDSSIIGEYSEEDYLEGKYFREGRGAPTDEVKKLFKILKSKILERFTDIEIKQKSRYAGFYSTKNDAALCTIVAYGKRIQLNYTIRIKDALPESEFVRYMVNPDGTKINHWGLGDYQSMIDTEKDIEKAFPLIEKVYNLKFNED